MDMGAQEGSLLYGLKIGDTKEIDGKTYLLEIVEEVSSCDGCSLDMGGICSIGVHKVGCLATDCILTEVKTEERRDDSDFEKIYSSLLKMQEAKNKAYGESALQPLDIFAKHHNYGSRLDEKLARVKNCDELKKNDVADLIGGLILICKDKGWTNFDDLID